MAIFDNKTLVFQCVMLKKYRQAAKMGCRYFDFRQDEAICIPSGDTVRMFRWPATEGDGHRTKIIIKLLYLLDLLIVYDSPRETRNHSHSIVPGGLPVMS